LAGSAATVKVLLEAGADPNAVTKHGMTPLQLAQALGWDKVVGLLVSKEAR
jgi:ankyrin repeat protein